MLTLKQQRFIDEYLLNGGNASSAARKAGYSKKNAHVSAAKLLANAKVRTEINERLEKIRSGKTADARELMEFLSGVVRGNERDEMLMQRLIGKGVQVIEKFDVVPNVRDRVKAAEILLRVYGEFREKVDVKVDSSAMFVEALERIWANDAEK